MKCFTKLIVCFVSVMVTLHGVKAAVSGTTCDPKNNDPTNGGAAVCKAVDENAECPDDTTSCACKYRYKEGGVNSDTCVLKEVVDFICDPANDDVTTGGAAVCAAVDANAECPDGEDKCKCKSGYKQDETDVNTCAKVLGGTCDAAGDCTGSVANSVCSTGKKCECEDKFIEESAVCKTAIGQACTDEEDCVLNAECNKECKCLSGFTDTNGLCAAKSSATSTWMTTGLLVTSMLIYLSGLILW